MELSEIIIHQIKEDGPISFHDFMEKSLYYPGKGYYVCAKEQIGKNGDFYTVSNVTSAFGVIIAKQVQQMWELLGEETFTIVEYGAGTGLLCHDILDYFKNFPALYDALHYCIIEKSPVMRERQKKYLKGNVSWYDSVIDISGFTGCVLSNELVDNFSVHQVVMEDELMEIFIDYEDCFTEIKRPAADILKNYFEELDVHLPRGHRTEINLEAINWIRDIAASMKKGYVITIDYGSVSPELYSPRKSCGTVLCYNKHTINEYPYNDIGKQDITSHVNFSALIHWGEQYGFENCGYSDLAHFLLSLGFKESLRATLQFEQDIIKMVQRESFLTQLLLVDMGGKFKVLIQGKGTPASPLCGFVNVKQGITTLQNTG